MAVWAGGGGGGRNLNVEREGVRCGWHEEQLETPMTMIVPWEGHPSQKSRQSKFRQKERSCIILQKEVTCAKRLHGMTRLSLNAGIFHPISVSK